MRVSEAARERSRLNRVLENVVSQARAGRGKAKSFGRSSIRGDIGFRGRFRKTGNRPWLRPGKGARSPEAAPFTDH